MTRKCHNHTLQTNPRHLAEKPQNTNSQMALKCITVKQPALYFPVRRLQNKKRQLVMRNRTMPKHNQPASQTHKTIGATIHHESNNIATVLERSAEVTGGLSYFYLQIFALEFAVVKSVKMLRSHGGFLTYPMYPHWETINSLNILWWNKEKCSQLTDSQSLRKTPVELRWAQLKANIRHWPTDESFMPGFSLSLKSDQPRISCISY